MEYFWLAFFFSFSTLNISFYCLLTYMILRRSLMCFWPLLLYKVRCFSPLASFLSFAFDFLHFEYNVPRYSFFPFAFVLGWFWGGGIYPAWCLLSFLDLWFGFCINLGKVGQPGWLSGLAPPSAQGVILKAWDWVSRQTPCMEPASPSACVSASLSLSLIPCLSWINK